MRVEEVMTKQVVAVAPELPLKHLARVLLANDISGVPVVSDGRVVGVASESDLVRYEAALPRASRTRFLRRKVDRARDGLCVADVMSSPAVTIEPWMSVGAAAVTLLANDVNRLPVVQRGRMVGIVARADLVRAFARSDKEIQREIVDEVLEALVPADYVGVKVHHGAVELEPEAGVDAEALARDVRRVPGVVRVHVADPQRTKAARSV